MTPAVVAPYNGASDREFHDEHHFHEGWEVTLTGEVEDVVCANALQLSDPGDDLGDDLADMEGESYVRATDVTVTQREE